MSRGAVARVFAVVFSAGCAGLVLGGCGGSERAAVRTITVTTDGQRVVTETSADEQDDGESEDEREEDLGCYGFGPPEICRRVPDTAGDCAATRAEAEAALTATDDQSRLAAAHLARAVALLCLGEQLDVAQADIAFARERDDELNDFSQETLERIGNDELPVGLDNVREDVFSGRTDVAGSPG